MNHQNIKINDIMIEVTRKSIKNLNLKISFSDGKIRLSVPTKMSYQDIQKAILPKIDWINKHQKTFKKQKKPKEKKFLTGESHFFLGKPYILYIENTNTKPHISLKGKENIHLAIHKVSSKIEKERVILDWYRKEMKKILHRLTKKWEKRIGVKASFYGIKKMKTRWGSCHPTQKRIWLNLELIKKPIYCLEYVLVHELTHFFERLHNENFKAHMDEFLPQWKSYQKELEHIET